MAVVNQLPQISGGDIIITYVGGGWKQASGGNEWGIGTDFFVNNDYWTKDGSGIRANKKFKALITLAQGIASDGSASNYRRLYNTSTDILQTPTGAYTEAHRIYEFEEGEYVKGWQYVGTNNLLSMTFITILAF